MNLTNKYQFIRFFDLIFVMRLLRLLKYMKFTSIMIDILKRTLFPFLSIGFILFLILFIFSLLGVELFRNNLTTNSFEGQEYSFQSFQLAFYSCFNLINLNNWYGFVSFGAKHSLGFESVVFSIIIMILGNFIVLNLFIAIMLDGFENLNLEEKNNEMNFFNKCMYPQIFGENDFEDVDEYFESDKFDEFSNIPFHNVRKNETEISDSSDEETFYDNKYLSKIMLNFISEESKIKNISIGSNSLFFLAKDNCFRKFFIKLLNNNYFYLFINLLILLSIIRLCLESFLQDNKVYDIFAFYITIFINNGFIFEAFTKIISFGLILNKNSYFRFYYNIFDFIIIIVGILELSFWSDKKYLNDFKVKTKIKNFNKFLNKGYNYR